MAKKKVVKVVNDDDADDVPVKDKKGQLSSKGKKAEGKLTGKKF